MSADHQGNGVIHCVWLFGCMWQKKSKCAIDSNIGLMYTI